jgi:hypothetical protein
MLGYHNFNIRFNQASGYFGGASTFGSYAF